MLNSESSFWYKLKVQNEVFREAMAEFLGTLVLTLCGNAMLASVFLGKAGAVSQAVVPFGWGLALTLALFVAGGVTGGHLNPAVTLAFATVGKFPWRKVLIFMGAQYLGAFVSSGVLFLVYRSAIEEFDPDRTVPPGIENQTTTAQIFSCYPTEYVTTANCLGDQVVATALLLIAICAITDERNMSVSKGMQPVAIGLSLTAIFYGFAMNCMNPLNPARDLGPRVFTAIAGWGTDVFSFRSYNWFWVPIVGPHIGGIVGVWFYQIFVEVQWPDGSYDFNGESSSAATVSTADLTQVQVQGLKVYQTKQ